MLFDHFCCCTPKDSTAAVSIALSLYEHVNMPLLFKDGHLFLAFCRGEDDVWASYHKLLGPLRPQPCPGSHHVPIQSRGELR